jgi:hypothetical protein
VFDSKVYNNGALIVGKMSGVVEPQSFINGIFWQIDSRNVGEVKDEFCQLYYDDEVTSVEVTEQDIRKIAEFNADTSMKIGRFRTALVLNHPDVIGLARLHQALAKEQGLEVEIFEDLEQGFEWLGCTNPDPQVIKL